MAEKKKPRVTRAAAEAAVQTLLRWAGDDPAREGLRDTPKRVVNAYGDWFSGYAIDPGAYLRRTFEEVEGYDEMVVLRDISFQVQKGETVCVLGPSGSGKSTLLRCINWLERPDAGQIYLNGKDYSNYLSETKKVAALRHDSMAQAIVNAAEKGFSSGRPQEMWESVLTVQKKFYQQGTLSPYPLAQTYAQLGENQEALNYLREAYDKRDAAVLFINTDRSFDGLRDDSSFQDLLARSGQPQSN